MNESKIKRLYNKFTFQAALLLAPLAYAIHQIEETTLGFREWRGKYFGATNPLPSEIFFAMLMALDIAYIILYNIWPNRVTAQIVLLGFLTTEFHNAFYHLIGSLYFGEFSPGLITGLLLYVPISCFIILRAYQENLMNKVSGTFLIVIAGVLFWTFEFIGVIIIVIFQIIVVLILVVYYFKSTRLSS